MGTTKCIASNIFVNLFSYAGLRSSNVGEQCEAIMKFPNLISQFPFPVLINTAFLKLADVFWSGYVFFEMCMYVWVVGGCGW